MAIGFQNTLLPQLKLGATKEGILLRIRILWYKYNCNFSIFRNDQGLRLLSDSRL